MWLSVRNQVLSSILFHTLYVLCSCYCPGDKVLSGRFNWINSISGRENHSMHSTATETKGKFTLQQHKEDKKNKKKSLK